MLVRLPLAERVEVTLNGRRVLGEKLLRPADLQPGDRATVAHDTRAVRIDAYRVLGTGGVIEQVHVDAGTIDVRVERAARPASFRIGPRCEVTLAGEPAELADLRRGDEVDITHDDPGAASPEPIALVARRPADERRFALLVANQQFDDRRLSPLSYPVPAAHPCAPSPPWPEPAKASARSRWRAASGGCSPRCWPRPTPARPTATATGASSRPSCTRT